MPRPLSREKLLTYGRCCGNGCQNCPYTPRHVGGSSHIASVGPVTTMCPICAVTGIEIRGKLVCPKCHTILETCCEGGPCHARLSPDEREQAVQGWKKLTTESAKRYHEKRSAECPPSEDLS